MNEKTIATSLRTLPVQAAIDQLKVELADFRANVALERAFDRQRISRLENTIGKAQPAQRDRGEILVALLATHGGKMSQREAITLMRLPKSRFSELLRTMKDKIEVRQSRLNRRHNILILK